MSASLLCLLCNWEAVGWSVAPWPGRVLDMGFEDQKPSVLRTSSGFRLNQGNVEMFEVGVNVLGWSVSGCLKSLFSRSLRRYVSSDSPSHALK